MVEKGSTVGQIALNNLTNCAGRGSEEGLNVSHVVGRVVFVVPVFAGFVALCLVCLGFSSGGMTRDDAQPVVVSLAAQSAGSSSEREVTPCEIASQIEQLAVANQREAVPRENAPGIPDNSLQALVVTTADWKHNLGILQVFDRAGQTEPWQVSDLSPVQVSLGRNGMAWGRGLHKTELPGPVKVEGDYCSPAGVFDLGEARGYAEGPPEGATWPFLHSGTRARCVDNERSNAYNTFVSAQGPVLIAASELAIRRQVFEYMVFVLHNTMQVQRGAGSCVFLHVWARPGQATHGCVGMDREALMKLMVWLDLDKRPVLVQLPRGVYDEVQELWGMPSGALLTEAGQ